MSTKIDDKQYMKYLFQSLNKKELQQKCRDFKIRGYSKLKKAELVNFLVDSASEDEMKQLLETEELNIISGAIDDAINIINGSAPESLKSIKIRDPDNHEIELEFKGFNWETSSFLSITGENIDDPDRDCDCRVGAESGLCPHFWVGFIFSYREKFFNLDEWIMTKLPKNFEDKIKNINIARDKVGEGAKVGSRARTPSSVSLVDESSAETQIAQFLDTRVTVYQGTVKKITERTGEYRGHSSTYYIFSLEDVTVGPQLERGEEKDQSKIKEVSNLNVRISRKTFGIGDKITCNGGLKKINYWNYILTRATKVRKV